VSVASGGLEGLEQIWDTRRPRAQGAVIGTAVAVVVHVAVAAALVRVDVSALLRGDTTVEMEVKEPPPPPPDIKPEPPPPPPPPEVKHVIVRHMVAPAPPPETPPPSEEPPKATDTPPVFGVSLDSTVGGDGPGIAVPIGNTLMTKPKKAGPPGPLPEAKGDPDRLPVPVPEILISEPARVLHEVIAAYPPELQRMGIEGTVTCKLLIDENGDVRSAKVVEKAGHGFDELAREALKKTKFSPAHTSDGKAVPSSILYKYRFELPQ
jgi:TonB family protein